MSLTVIQNFFKKPAFVALTVCILVAIVVILGVIIAAAAGSFTPVTPSTNASTSVTPSTIGNVAKARDSSDLNTGQVVLQHADLSDKANQKITAWSFYNDTNSLSVTPVLAEKTSDGTYIIRGIGTTVHSAKMTSAQSQPFGLVSGTDKIGTNFYVGHYHGSVTSAAADVGVGNTGSVEYDSVPDEFGSVDIASTGVIFIGPTKSNVDADASIYLGQTLYPTSSITRVYSVNFTAGSA